MGGKDYNIWWATLPERCGAANDQCYNAILDVAENCGRLGYNHIRIGYTRTDFARNEICRVFMEQSQRDNDTLVMVDSDHRHPANIVEHLANLGINLGVVGALAYRRGEPFDPLFFVRVNGALFPPADFELGKVYECAIVSTSAIAIRRWVFLELQQHGWIYPWFKYEYPVAQGCPSEDMYFGRICEQSGIPHHCDTSIVIPHSRYDWVDKNTQAAYIAAHPELIKTLNVEAPK